MKFLKTKQSGVTLIEVLIAITVIAAIIIVVGFSITTYVDARSNLLNNAKSLYLAEEGYEILRALREDDWETIDALAVGDTYYFDVATNTLAIVGVPEVIDGDFTRSFVLEEVCRDSGSDDIVDCLIGGTYTDDETLSVTMSVNGPTGTTSLTALIANIHAI